MTKFVNSYICLYHANNYFELDYDLNLLIPLRSGKSISPTVYENKPDNEAVIVLTRHSTHLINLDSIIDYIKTQSIIKISFFIEDVLTCYNSETLEIVSFDSNSNTIRSFDLDIIKFIIDNTDIDYDLFHCEYNAEHFSKIYNLRIQYCDVFLLFATMFSPTSTKVKYAFTHKLSCFNARAEIHRYIISALLYNQSDTLLTLLFRESAHNIINNNKILLDDFSPLVKEKIINGCNYFENNDVDLSWDIKYNKSRSTFVSLNSVRQAKNITAIQDSAISLVTETRFYSTMPNFSEKVIKPISVCRPFILLAPPYTLKLIKDLGFKTFDEWWDESYDSINNHSQRLEAVYNIAIELLLKDTTELTDMLNEMTDTLLYNSKNLKCIYEPMMQLNNNK